MKKVIAILATAAVACMLNAAPTIYVVDMAQAYQNYYKAKAAQEQINASLGTARAELEKMKAEYDALVKEVQAVQEKVKSPAMSEKAKEETFRKEAQPKLVKISQIEKNMRSMSEETQRNIQRSAAEIRKYHMDEIKKVVEKIASEKRADFIMEKGACYFYKPDADITQDLIKALNASAPKTVTK